MLWLAAWAATPAAVQASSAPEVMAPRALSTVEVIADRPPPMWRFQRGDKRILLLGSYYPLLEKTRFNQSLVEQHAATAEAFLTPPGLVVDDSVGLFKGLSLWGAVREARRNPEGKRLHEVLPPELLTRWREAKQRHLGRDRSVEKLRPMYAAFELYEAALKRSDLALNSVLRPMIEALAERRDVSLVDARVHVPVEASKLTARAFEVEADADLACLEQTLERLEPTLQFAPLAAEAWANGDVERLREIESQYDLPQSCWARLTNESLARMAGMADAYERIPATWVATAYRELERVDSVFSYAYVGDLIERRGIAALLIADGWQMEPVGRAAEAVSAPAIGPAESGHSP